MAIKIGTISISLSAETASFQSDMTRASQIALNSSKNIERSFNLMAGAITAATGAATVSLGYLIEKTQETIFSMQKMAQQAGVSMESFSKLAYAAKLAGVPLEQMSVIATRIGHTAFDAASGNKEAAEAYRNLGVKVMDANGHFKTADQLFIEVAKSLNKYRDDGAKLGYEQLLMGRSGAQVSSMLKLVADRFDETSAKAQKLGVVFDEKTAESARRLHEDITDLEEAAFGLSVKLLSNVSPALEQVAQKLVQLATKQQTIDEFKVIADDISKAVTMTANAFEYLADHAETLKHALEAFALIRAATFFGPMVSSASETGGFISKLSIAMLNLSGNLFGLKRMGNVLAPMAKGAKDYVGTLAELASEEGVAATGSYALAEAASAAGAALEGIAATALPLAAVGAAIFDIYEITKSTHEMNKELKQDGLDWKDTWQSAISSTIGSWEALKNTISGVMQMGPSYLGFAMGLDLSKKAPDKSMLTGPKAPGVPSDYNYDGGTTGTEKSLNSLPALEKGAKKTDELARKLAELAEAARKAQESVRLVGALPEAQRDAEILHKYNDFLITQADRLKALSVAKRTKAKNEALESITTEVNDGWQQKLISTLLEQKMATSGAAAEHLAMADALNKGAEAMEKATIAAKVNAEFQKIGGPDWAKDPQLLAASVKRTQELTDQMRAESQYNDQKSIKSTQLQIEAQNKLNDAIMRGSDAKRQAELENEIAQIKADFNQRGDTRDDLRDQMIEQAKQKSAAVQEAQDRERAAAMDITLRYQEQKQAIQDAADAAVRAGHALDQREILAANKEAWLQYREASNKAILATGSGIDGLKVAMDELAHDTESAAQKMHDAFLQTLNELNDVLARLATEKHHPGDHAVRNAFSGFFRSQGQKLATTGLKKAESAVAEHFGIHGKPDGSKTKPFWVRFDDEIKKLLGQGRNQTDYQQGAGQGVNELAQLLSGSGSSGDSSGGSSTSGGSSIVGTILGAVIQGMFADGTDSLIPGVPAIVGEKGPELFVPPSSGAIVPNHKLGGVMGGGHHIYIDARGSQDPAQTTALIHQYMQKAAPQIVQHTIKTIHENRLRSPATAPSR